MNLQNVFGRAIGDSLPAWRTPPRPQGTVLTGWTCVLEPLQIERHAHDLFAANRIDDGRMWTYLPYGPFEAFATYRDWAAVICQGNDPLFYAIVPVKAEGQETDTSAQKAAGLASYLRIMPESGSLEIGHLAFSPQLQATTAATEATFLMMKHAFEIGHRRCEWKCDALNQKSRIAAQRLGFSFEGVFRQATLYKGRNRDTAWYAVIDKDWPVLEQAFETWLQLENFGPDGRQRTSLSDLTAPVLERPG